MKNWRIWLHRAGLLTFAAAMLVICGLGMGLGGLALYGAATGQVVSLGFILSAVVMAVGNFAAVYGVVWIVIREWRVRE